MVSGEVGRGSCKHIQDPCVMLLCFGRLKGIQCNLEGWPKNNNDLGSLSQEGLHL